VVRLIEEAVGQARKPGSLCRCNQRDVPETCEDVSDLERAVGFRPRTRSGRGPPLVDWSPPSARMESDASEAP